MLAPERDIIVPQNRPSRGPKVSGLEAFKAVYDEQKWSYSVLGAENRLQEMAENNRARVKQLTGRDIPLARRPFEALGFDFTTTPRLRASEEQEALEESRQIMDQLKELKAQHPDIQTYEEMVAEVRRENADREAHGDEISARSGPWAKFTGFVGGMAGAFTRNDPMNVASLGLSGGGRTFATRVLSEMGMNSMVEGINQFFGVTDNRRLLGREFTTEEKVLNTTFAGLGAGFLRAGGEGFSAGIRKLSKKVKEGRAISRDDLLDALREDSLTQGVIGREEVQGEIDQLAARIEEIDDAVEDGVPDSEKLALLEEKEQIRRRLRSLKDVALPLTRIGTPTKAQVEELMELERASEGAQTVEEIHRIQKKIDRIREDVRSKAAGPRRDGVKSSAANRAAQMALDAETQIRDLNPFDRSRASQAVHEALYARAHKQITEPFDPSELEVPRSSTAKGEHDFIDEALAARGIREDDLIQQARDTFARLREVPQNLEQARTLALREREGKIREELSAEAGQKLTRAEVKKLQAEQKQLRKQIEELDRSFKETATKPTKKKGAKRKAPPKDAAQQRKAAETRLEETEAKVKAHERGAKAEADLSRLEQGKFPEAYKAELEGRARELEALAEHFVRETAPAARGYSAHEAMTTVDDLETRLSENLDEVVDAQVETAIRGMDDGEAKADLGLADDVDLDMKLKVVDDEGNVTGEITVREALQDIKADDALVRAVRECGV